MPLGNAADASPALSLARCCTPLKRTLSRLSRDNHVACKLEVHPKSSRGGDLSEGVCWRALLARIYGTRDAFHSSLAFDVIPALVKACFALETAEALLLV